MALNKGVLQLNPFAKYAVAFPKISRSIFTLASSALSPAKLHLLGADWLAVCACEFARALCLDPVIQRLRNYPQRSGRRRHALPCPNQSDRLLLELKRVPCP